MMVSLFVLFFGEFRFSCDIAFLLHFGVTAA